MLKTFFVFIFLLATGQALAEKPPKLDYAVGKSKHDQNYLDASSCQFSPCVINKFAAIKLDKKIKNRYSVEIGYVHEHSYQRLSLYQASSTLDEKFAERLFNNRPNRQIFNLENDINRGANDVIFLYGIRLQYSFDEGDVLVVTLKDIKNPANVHEYYFHYHVPGPIWDIDVSLIFPINYFKPNPATVIRSSRVALGVSYSLGWYMDPTREYSFGQKFWHSFKFNIVGGALTRQEVVTYIAGDRVVDTKFDGFVGGGFTFLDFFTAGYGVNLIRSPHSTFPFVGIETKKLYELIRSTKRNTGKKWKRYLEKQYQSGI